MKKIIFYFLVFILLGAGAYASYRYYYQLKTKVGQTEKKTLIQDGEENIRVFSPKPGDTIGLPLKILGEARVFENQFNVRIKDSNGNIIKEVGIMAEGGDIGQFNLFSKDINYNKPGTYEGTIEFFDYSAKDGSEIDKVVIPVKFETVYNALNIKAYFGNSQKNPNAEDCEKVYPVNRRIIYTKNTAEAAIKELLEGITNNEQENGYFTSINSGVKLNKITIKNGIAYADFDEMLELNIGGSCRVSSIRAQIEQTILQFGTANEVVISINGRSEDILQP